MSWHYYCWAIGYGQSDQAQVPEAIVVVAVLYKRCVQEYDPVLRSFCDDVLGPMVFDTVEKRSGEIGGSASMLTEFGICEPRHSLPNSLGE